VRLLLMLLTGACFGGSFGAVRTFQSGFALGAVIPRVAVILIKSLSKNTSNDTLGIGKDNSVTDRLRTGANDFFNNYRNL